MTKKILSFFLTLISILFSSCLSDSDECPTYEKHVIKILAKIDNTHIYAARKSSKLSFENNDNIGIYWTNYVNNKPLSIETSSEFRNMEYIHSNQIWNGKHNKNLHLPTDTSVGDIYAYYPFDNNIDINSDKKKLRAYPFTVEQDQTSSSVKNDFLWAKDSLISLKKMTAELTFHHLLSKVVVNITYGDLGNNYNDILIENITRNSIIDLQTGQVKNTGNITFIKPYVHRDANIGFDKTLSAIVVPQKIEMGKSLFSITIKNKKYNYTLDQDLFLESGFEYIFNLIIGEANLKDQYQDTISLTDKSLL